MASKHEEKMAFQRLIKSVGNGTATLTLDYWRWNNGSESAQYKAYASSPAPTFGEPCDDPMEAVESLLERIERTDKNDSNPA